MDYGEFFERISQRYRGVDARALESALRPILIPIHTLDKTIVRLPGQGHYRASFSVLLKDDNRIFIQRGRTGKFVPKEYVQGGSWREIAKGRIIEVDRVAGVASGEVYTGGRRTDLESALAELTDEDYLEVDQYGAAAKVLSALVEHFLVRDSIQRGYIVRRMPEDIARHLGTYYHYDFEFEKDGICKRVEVKSLWGTNTRYARLIHSLTKDYKTSSCRFDAQDILAVSLFLRTGDIRDFAFARSVPKDVRPYGLPRASMHPEYVNQNPVCVIGDGTWFGTIEEVWDLD